MPGLIGPGTMISHRSKRVRLWVPGDPIPDGDGGYIEPEVPLTPEYVSARVRPASQTNLEGIAAGTILAQTTHIVTFPFHPGVTIETVIEMEDYPRPSRRLSVIHITNPETRNADLELLCAEVMQ